MAGGPLPRIAHMRGPAGQGWKNARHGVEVFSWHHLSAPDGYPQGRVLDRLQARHCGVGGNGVGNRIERVMVLVSQFTSLYYYTRS